MGVFKRGDFFDEKFITVGCLRGASAPLFKIFPFPLLGEGDTGDRVTK